jgi:hypothetical protein
MKRLIWINGAFGAGKTTVASKLVASLPGYLQFDPEQLGFLLRKYFPTEQQKTDFRKLKLWRHLTVETAAGLISETSRSLVVPMSLIWPQDLNYIIDRLTSNGIEVHHFSLVAKPETLRRRLIRRLAKPSSTLWALRQIDECVKALSSPDFATHIEVDARSPGAIRDEILAHLDAR